MTTKTPVSMLQEMCIRKSTLPHYELIHDGGGSHEALFKYKVCVGEVIAVGSGRSKKEAKHDAAKIILKRLQEEGGSSPDISAAEVMDVSSPYKGKLQENAVGALQELCLTNDIQVPEYKVVGDEGPPHEKQFTLLCQVSKLEETAVARTKKQAKQLAAHKMLNRLKTSMGHVLNMSTAEKSESSDKKYDSDPDAEVVVNKFKELGTLGSSTRRIPFGQKISEYHLTLKSLDGELLKKLKEGDNELQREIQDDVMEVLKRLLEELNLDADFNGIGTTSPDKCIVLLSISTSPESVVFGEGDSNENACKMAAIKGLEYLKLMTV
ncbi:interferon-inducible double-stranded RNA-dependent protein kinase activator A homolog [Periplaneta americana]|uniref:interferon-inducible double-stranded RNA-dependent protein kinase activator A homolog n=1 Tax=Periplaneta americana TaxID=6978 RepID=UPI0037E7D867